MITTVTLNASIDKAYHMKEKIQNGTVMRVASTRNSAGGKGLNVARVVYLCGEDVLATGLVGGYNGQYLEALLDQDGIAHDFEHIKGETRSCINILDPEWGSTEYLEAGCEVTPEEEASFLAHFETIVQKSEIIAISGSAPQGVAKNIYAQMIASAKEAGKIVILDTSGVFLQQGIKACPTMVKPNQEELEAFFQTTIQTVEDLVFYAKKLYEMGIAYVVISLGGDGALMVCEDGIFQGIPPKVDVVNTVGCGDSMVGAFAVALSRKYDAQKALKYAVASATANAMSSETGSFERAVSQKLMEEVVICKL